MSDDLATIARIDVVPRILEVICRATGLGFAAVARVTEDRWVACAVRDEIAFGLEPGGEFAVETTICHEIRHTGRRVVIDHVDADALFATHPTPKRYGFQSYIAVPITLPDGRFFGTLCAIDPKPAQVNTPETVAMFELFAELIAFHLVADDHVAELERLVATRTAELRELIQRLERLREDERTAVARELHDAFGQSLTALRFAVRAAHETVTQSSGIAPTALTERLDTMETLIDAALDDIERIVSDLRPAALDTLGCASAIVWFTARFERSTGLQTTIDVDSALDTLPATTSTVLFRILQEALTNVSRHAHAASVHVRLLTEAGDVVLSIEDDGCGLTEDNRTKAGTFGLRGMTERVRAAHGSLTFASATRAGLQVVVRIPVAHAS